jgi:hypothetical protein
MNVPNHYRAFHHGFWSVLDGTLPPDTSAALPCTSDRFLENIHFAELAVSIPPDPVGTMHVNWYTSAHIAAYIGIFEAAKHDISSWSKSAKFDDTSLGKELRVNPHASDFAYKDPLNATSIYRSLRHLRVHFGWPIVLLDRSLFVSSEPHWYFRPIDLATYKLLKQSPLKEGDLDEYNAYLQRDTIIDIFGRMAGIIRQHIIETGKLSQ